MGDKVSCIAYYLGQFHPTPDNDRFWGEGFTEWHNVARARPLYPSHVQPKLPGRFGFYDLRCAETLSSQIDYAKQIGINSFCYWHYWFSGRRLLYRPLDDMLKLKRRDFRFMLGWANESWSGVWHGAAHKILVEQVYDAHELSKHAELLSSYITNGQYLEIGGNFPLLIYKPRAIPNAKDYLGDLKEKILRLTGAKVYLIGNWSPGRNYEFSDPGDYGLDAAVITPVAAYFRSQLVGQGYRLFWHILRKTKLGPEIGDYRRVSATLRQAKSAILGVSHATVVTGWDNTPRSGRRGLVLRGFDEDSFRQATRDALALEKNNAMPMLFVKSWNEWAEGNTVEPLYREKWSVGLTLEEILSRE